MFDLRILQLPPVWIPIVLLGLELFILLGIGFRIIRLLQYLVHGEKSHFLVWPEVCLGMSLAMMFSFFVLLLLWFGAMLQWESPIDSQCLQHLMPLLAHPTNALVFFVLVVAGVGVWASGWWLRHNKSLLSVTSSS
jgi:hypothetical protein